MFSKDRELTFAEILAGKLITLFSDSSSEPQVNKIVQIKSLNKFFIVIFQMYNCFSLVLNFCL